MALEENIILERWSHSEEVDEYVEYLYDRIADAVPYAQRSVIMEDALDLITGSCGVVVFGINLRLNFFVYVADGKESLDMAVNECDSLSGISEDGKELYLTVYTVNGEVVEGVSNKNLYHEVEHLLQMSKGRKDGEEFMNLMDKAYRIAQGVIRNTDSDPVSQNIAWLFYYSNPHEQDAFMNEYYFDLVKMRQSLVDKNNETHQILDRYKKLYDWYVKNRFSPLVIRELSKYSNSGISQRGFEVMLRKGVSRFEKKMMNVEKHKRELTKRLNEMHYIDLIHTYNGGLIFLT